MATYELNIQDYLRILRKRKWIIFSFVMIAFVFSFIYTSFSIPHYRSSTTVAFIQRETATNALLTEMVVWNPGDVMETASKTITSHAVMKAVGEKMGLIRSGMSDMETDAVVNSIVNEVFTKQVGNTNLITITATSLSPERAFEIAKYTSESFIEENLRTKSKQTQSVRDFVEKQLANYQQQLTQSEQALLTFKESLPLDQRTTNLEETTTLKDDPLIAGLESKLVDQKLHLNLLLQEFTEEHPAVVSLQQEISILSQTLTKEKERYLGKLRELPERQVTFARLLRNLELNKELYNKFRDRLEEVKIQQAHEVEDITIVEPPSEPYMLGTGRGKKVITGILLGLVLGLVVSFLRETLDTSIGTIEDVEEYLKIPVLGVIPHINVDQETYTIVEQHRHHWFEQLQRLIGSYEEDINMLRGRLIFSATDQSVISEAYRILQTNLQFTALDKKRTTIVFTSVGAGEGKTLSSINSAVSMAQMGKKVLLVDCDYRRPTVNKILGLPRENGLSEVVLGKNTLEENIRNVTDIMLGEISSKKILQSPGIENFHVITTGAIPLNPPSLLGSEKMSEIIREMKSKFDVVIFDSAPVLPVTDTLIMASKTDTSVLVYQSGRAARGALKRAKEQLTNIQAHVTGVVLNNIAASEMKPTATYYHYERKD